MLETRLSKSVGHNYCLAFVCLHFFVYVTIHVTTPYVDMKQSMRSNCAKKATSLPRSLRMATNKSMRRCTWTSESITERVFRVHRKLRMNNVG